MNWLTSFDLTLFEFVHRGMQNRAFDWIVWLISQNTFFFALLLMGGVAVLRYGGGRGRLCLVMMAVVVLFGDGVFCNNLKKTIARPRPPEERISSVPAKETEGGDSMPSSHVANWFAATLVLGRYYRRSWRWMVPLAIVVAFSRVYKGAHYPGDVLAGAILGAAYSALMLWLIEVSWRFVGTRWFPIWHEKLPSLIRINDQEPKIMPAASAKTDSVRLDQHWLRLGYLVIGTVLVARLFYLASGIIELSADEAYQWIWSKHLDLSYYSKPPMIAWVQFLGTSLWGDSAFGVRFFSPVISAVLSWVLLRFIARELNARSAFWLVLISNAAPMLGVGSILMTIDPLSVLFWCVAMVCGWKATQTDSTALWAWTGLAMGLGFLSKYTALFQWISWAVFFALCRSARGQLRRPGPYLALLINLLCAIPVLIWNQHHQWITVTHLAERGGLTSEWHPTLKYLVEFIFVETVLLNPIFFVGMIWAAVALWKSPERQPLSIYLWSMGVPLFIFYLAFTLRHHVEPNWIVPSVLPLFCLMVIYWERRWQNGVRAVRGWLTAGLVFGLVVVVILHDTNLIQKVIGRPLPAKSDPLTRVRSWRETAAFVGGVRKNLLSEGKPVFIIGSHYGITSLITFYLPEAKEGVPNNAFVYFRSSARPENQFYFWSGYSDRHGQNAIYVAETDAPQLPPESLLTEFQTVTDLGIADIHYRGRVLHKIQLFACRNLR